MLRQRGVVVEIRDSSALPLASSTGLQHNIILAHASFSRATIVYIASPGRQCFTRPQDQNPTAAVPQLRWRGRATHPNLRRCAQGKWLWFFGNPSSHELVALTLRSLRLHPSRLCCLAVFQCKPTFSLSLLEPTISDGHVRRSHFRD